MNIKFRILRHLYRITCAHRLGYGSRNFQFRFAGLRIRAQLSGHHYLATVEIGRLTVWCDPHTGRPFHWFIQRTPDQLKMWRDSWFAESGYVSVFADLLDPPQ